MQTNIFLITFGLSFLIQILFFIFAAYFKTDKVTDLSYGLTFIILAFFSLFYTQNFSFHALIVVFMVTAWGLRLASYLFIRILKTKKDKRFDGIRENFIKFAKFWFFQAIAVWAISLPAIYLISTTNYTGAYAISILVLGVLIWFVGFALETVADLQKFRFNNDIRNKGKWIQSGLWKYARFPNYFGEMLCWWGIFVVALPIISAIGWLIIIGPIFITYILLFVSGIPPLEKIYNQVYADNKEFQEYKKSTRLLVPLP